MTPVKSLQLSKDLDLPLDAVTQTFALLGRRGSGKTYGAGKLAELMLDAGAQVVVLDPIGTWYGLRLSADGKGKGFNVPVFGGERGDVPLEPQAGALIAKLLVEERFSAVLDVSTFRKEQRKQFVTDFAEELMHRKKTNRSALHVFFEEAQLFIPQMVGGKEARMVGAFEDLIKLGRNYGIGASLLSQRPQSVNKDVLNQTECLLAFQMTGPQERKTIDGWISDKGIDEKLSDVLPSLPVGHARLWSPQWLRISKTIHIAKKKTFDASSTPTVGAAIVQPKELSPVDVQKIKESMADVVKRAEATDPKKLHAEIAKLRRELEAAQKVPAKSVEVEVPMVPAGMVLDLTNLAEEMGKRLEKLRGDLESIAAFHQHNLGIIISSNIDLQSQMPPPQPARIADKTPVKVPPGLQDRPVNKLSPAEDRGLRSALALPAESDLTGIHVRIVNALAELASFGVTQPNRLQLGFYLGNNLTSGYGSRAVGELKTRGLVDYPAGGLLQLTQSGFDHATDFDIPTSLTDFHERIRRHLNGLHERIFTVLVDTYYQGPLSRPELGGMLAVNLTSGYGSRCVGELKTAGLLVYPAPGSLQASKMLFPEGLK